MDHTPLSESGKKVAVAMRLTDRCESVTNKEESPKQPFGQPSSQSIHVSLLHPEWRSGCLTALHGKINKPYGQNFPTTQSPRRQLELPIWVYQSLLQASGSLLRLWSSGDPASGRQTCRASSTIVRCPCLLRQERRPQFAHPLTCPLLAFSLALCSKFCDAVRTSPTLRALQPHCHLVFILTDQQSSVCANVALIGTDRRKHFPQRTRAHWFGNGG